MQTTGAPAGSGNYNPIGCASNDFSENSFLMETDKFVYRFSYCSKAASYLLIGDSGSVLYVNKYKGVSPANIKVLDQGQISKTWKTNTRNLPPVINLANILLSLRYNRQLQITIKKVKITRTNSLVMH